MAVGVIPALLQQFNAELSATDALQVLAQRSLVEQPGLNRNGYAVQDAPIILPIGLVGLVLTRRMVVKCALFHNTGLGIGFGINPARATGRGGRMRQNASTCTPVALWLVIS